MTTLPPATTPDPAPGDPAGTAAHQPADLPGTAPDRTSGPLDGPESASAPQEPASAPQEPASAPQEPATAPPHAKRVPSGRTRHGETVIDEYAWLADKDDPDTIAYLKAENAYTDKRTAHLAPLRDRVFNEIKARTRETDLSVPSRKGGWWYYSRTVEGQQYGIQCRRRVREGETEPPSTVDGRPLPGEEVLLDGNALAAGHEFFALGSFEVTPAGDRLAYSVDTTGDERFTLHVKDLTTGELLPDQIPDTFYGCAWSLDGSTLFYVTIDEAWRPHRVWRHVLGKPVDSDAIVYEDADERFWVGVELTRSERFLLIGSSSKLTSEVHVIPADRPEAPPRVIAPRRHGVEYEVEHQGDRFLILHNDGALDFALAYTPVDGPGEWTTLLPHEPGTRLMGVDAFDRYVVVSLRRDGLTGVRVLPAGDGAGSGAGSGAAAGDRAAGDAAGDGYDIAFPEPLYTVGVDDNPDYHQRTLRLHYASLVTPDSVYDADLATGELTLRRRKPVLGGFDPDRYEQHREWATAGDGTRIPISLVCRAGMPRDGSAPLVLYGYGSYETSIDPWFSVPRLSLVDRGVVFAVAHVRGGGEMGRAWYDEGKLLAKKNTFTDFVAAARHLSGTWTAPDRLVARGGSAGGLLMGAVANLAPDAFAGIVAQVPFVDALNTILDPSLPLTVTEWEEWGDPLHDPEVYAYMRSYTPYENVTAVRYPAILAVTSLNDTRVLYHEPAKWVARLRAVSPETTVLLKTEMAAGHGGPSGRYNAWREEAFVAAWILDVLGAAGT